TFFRNARKRPGAAAINLLGLSTGLAAGVLILLFIFHEFSYDRFHRDFRSIYRINLNYINKDGSYMGSQIPAAVGPDLAGSFPEIQSFCRLTSSRDMYFQVNDKIIQTSNSIFADSVFFRFFSFPLVTGNPDEVLSGLHQLVLSRDLAKNLFGDDNPVGKTVLMNGTETWQVSGIAENSPLNSTIRFDAILSFETLYTDPSLFMDWNGGNQYETYVKVVPDFDAANFSTKSEAFMNSRVNNRLAGSGFRVEMIPEAMQDIHLYSLGGDSEGSISNIRIFALIALFILLVACFNFTNMAAASAIYRAKETGIRKVLGATRAMLIRQYLAESILLTIVAALFSLIITELCLPYYNVLINKELHLFQGQFLLFPSVFFILVLSTGFIAGIFPSWFLSSYEPVVTLKGGFVSTRSRQWIPRILVVLQFVIAACLLNCIWLINRQLDYIQNFDIGFRSKNVYGLALPGQSSQNQVQLLRSAFEEQAGIEASGATSELPSAGVTMNGYFPEDYTQPVMIHVMDIDDGFLKTIGMEIIAGRGFDEADRGKNTSCIVNEAYVQQYAPDAPIGKKISRDGDRTIIGVVKNFHFASLHEAIQPLILTNQANHGYQIIMIRLNGESVQKSLAEVEKIWSILLPNDPFILIPLPEYLQASYTEEKRFATVISWFAGLAIFISMIGLLGLSSLILRMRTKELGIRKILGASQKQLILSSLIEFSLLVLIANAIAVIPVILFMERWLAGFNYTISINVSGFLITLLLTLLTGVLSVGWQAVRASRVKTVDIIKYE
ncbi:MAG: ABC transporter permease, partial [Bacteroidales bacterium]